MNLPGLQTCLLVVCLSPACGQRVITNFAGADWLFPGDGRPAVQAPLGGIFSLDIAADRNGNYYICDSDNEMVMRVGPDGIINVVAGNGLVGLSGDGGLAVNASLDTPQGIAIDLSGNLYIAENGGRVRKVTADGIITTLAGNGTQGYSGDHGPATLAQLSQPTGVAVDSAGNVYIADYGNQVIRRVTPDGTITTVAGTGQPGFSGDRGPATSAKLNRPTRVAVDSSGNLYIVETSNSRIRKVTNGIIDTLAGGGVDLAGEGIPATSAALLPTAVVVDSSGNVYVDDFAFSRVRKIDLQGNITTIAGASGTSGFAGDGGPALKALFNFGPYSGIAIDSTGAILVGDDQNRRVRKITADRNINTVAGNGLYRFSGDGGPATSATLYLPYSVIADAAGNVFISETGQNRIRKVAPDGTISVYAGTGLAGHTGDNGPAAKATLNYPTYLGIGIDGNLYFSDSQNHVIRRIDRNGIITTVAGNGFATYGGDGQPATQASLASPSGIDFDGAGEMIIADTANNRIRLVTSDGKMLTLAGNGQPGYSGDNDSSLKAVLNKPVGLAIFDAVYFCDSGNNVVRRISATDLKITTVAGNGKAGYSGDGGQAKNASLNNPQGLTFDGDGNLYIADEANFAVRKVAVDGTITTFAGSPTANSIGDGGIATNAFLRGPTDVTVDLAGNVLIAELPGNHIREVLAAAPSFQVSTNNVAFTAPAGSSAIDQTVNLTGSIPGIAYTATVPASSPWLTVSPATGSMPAALRITADPSKLSLGPSQANITVTAPNAKPSSANITVALTATAPGQPSLNVQPAALTFSFVQQSAARSRTLTVSNAGGGSLAASVTTAVNVARVWLKASASNIQLSAFGSSVLNITADPAGQNPGTYTGFITVSSTNPAQSVTVAVTMTVSAVPQTILIPQTGLTFFAVQGGGPTAPQFFNILNTGVGQMRWSVKATTLTGGSWLAAFPGNGVSDAASPLVPTVRLDVNPQNLSPGIYAASVQVTAPDADNTPQFVSVFLNVLAPGSKIGPIVQPSAMIFAAVSGAESPGSQSLLVQSLSSTAVSFNSSSVTADGANWLTVLPRDGSITAAQPVRIVVQPNTQTLSPGVYRATITLAFSDGNARSIAVVLVLVPPGSKLASASSPARPEQATSGCTPKMLIPVFTLLLNGFSLPAGFPGQIAVKVVDDCANPMTTGDVQVMFSNGDADMHLDSLKDGTWAQTWTPLHNVSPVTVTATATTQNLNGQVQIKGGLLTFDTPPAVGTGAIVNGASFAQQTPVAPGSLISIFGSKLAQGQALAGTLPLPLNLAGSSVVLAGVAAPMLFANDGQVNAVVPFETAVNTPQHIVLMRGTTPSVPQSITVAPAAPGIFTKDSSGKGQGVIFGVDASGAQILADSARPVKAGDVVVIYCTGLGNVNPPVPTGSPTPLGLFNAVNQPTVTVGGVSAGVAFAGLTPGFVGLYQVNATIPQGVAPGNQVPVVITTTGQPSLPVTIAVR